MLFTPSFKPGRNKRLQYCVQQRIISSTPEVAAGFDILEDGRDPRMIATVCQATKWLAKCKRADDVECEELKVEILASGSINALLGEVVHCTT